MVRVVVAVAGGVERHAFGGKQLYEARVDRVKRVPGAFALGGVRLVRDQDEPVAGLAQGA